MNDVQLTPEQIFQRDVQRTQLKMDLVKHVSTLSSGAIVILATFLNRSSPSSVGRPWLLISVVSLVICLVLSLLYFWRFGLARQWRRLEPSASARRAEWIIGCLVALEFSLGILCLGVFVIENVPK
jgi:hypothetical protein